MSAPSSEPSSRRKTWAGVVAVAAFLVVVVLVAATTSDPAEEPVQARDAGETGARADTPSYTADIQPIFNVRCIACHGCLGSPCNVKLTSFRGTDRGGFGKNPYSSRLEDSPRTDMDVVPTTEAWRERGFYPILSREGSAEENLARSLLYRMVEAGAAHNEPGFSRKELMPLYAKRYDHQCPASPDALETYLGRHTGAGMPFGLPALHADDLATLRSWIAGGSPGPSDAERSAAAIPSDPAAVLAWEEFFNAADKRSQLVARYIFDHVFLATIVLDESPGDFFKLVRSKTPSSTPVEIIDTPLPYTDPYAYAGVDRFYYRLKKVTAPIIQKNHFVWRLGRADIDHLKTLFLADDWGDTGELDAPWGVGNPFLVFQAIPTEARYRFLLENAELIISGITYGPVCLGQTATFAVKDQFWVYFVDPAFDVSVQDPNLGLETWNAFMDRSLIGNDVYEAAYAAALKKLRPQGYSIDAIWNGGGENPNAWLTVLRHESNVSVMKGPQGGIPRTQWLMDYSGFERIYYDTVASFETGPGTFPSSRHSCSSTICARSLRTISCCSCRKTNARRSATTGPKGSARWPLPWSPSPEPTNPRKSKPILAIPW